MNKLFLQKLRMVASEADDLLTSCDASDLLDGLEVARDFMFEAACLIEQLESRLAQVERERDAAVADLIAVDEKYEVLKNAIDDVIHKELPYSDYIDFRNYADAIIEHEHADVWRGVCPENTKEET